METGEFCYDFYFMGKFVKRFNTYSQAKKLVTWNENLTHPSNLYEIKAVRKTKEMKGKKIICGVLKNILYMKH